jgi:patatin-like phospholipase/acyl hydrolase
MTVRQPKRKYIAVLSIDGGGIRGIVPGQVLAMLEEKLKERSGRPETRLVDYFDLMAGTGTGGIMACAYLSPVKPHNSTPRFSAQQVVDLYMKHGARIFEETLDHKILSVGGLLDEKFASDGIEGVLMDYFDTLQLSQLLKPSLITAYDITKRKTHFFTQHTADKPSFDFYVRDIARATSAAPTYFECKRMQSLSGVSYALVDGSVFAGNPALCAYAEASKIYHTRDASSVQVTPPQILMLSLGTGLPKAHYEFDDAKGWGLASWSRPLLDMVTSGVAESVDYQLKSLYTSINASNLYLRINPELSINVKAEMDNASAENLQALKELGLYTAEAYEAQLDAFVDLLLME